MMSSVSSPLAHIALRESQRVNMTSNVAALARRMSLAHIVPEIDIVLDDHNDTLFTYTTGSALSGVAHITPTKPTEFNEILITLEGVTRVSIDQMNQVAGPTKVEASHTFLKLTMPIPDSAYPQPRIAETGMTYDFPFNFVIPKQLLEHSCAHKCDNPTVHAAHLNLPPSIGDHELSPICDMTPSMCKVVYSVVVKILKFKEDGKFTAIHTTAKKIRVIPDYPDEPPLHVEPSDTEYAFIRTKKLKKGMFKGKLGNVTLTAAQTTPLVVSSNSEQSTPATIFAELKLRFDPADSTCQPPRIGSLNTKIKVLTFASFRAQTELAKKSSALASYDPAHDAYSVSVNLSPLTLDSAASWTFHPDSPMYMRRDSGYSSTDDLNHVNVNGGSQPPSPENKPSGPGYYESTILAPISVPNNKTWVPTFHSCLVSRIYSIDFHLSVGAGVSTSFNLRMPIQVASYKSRSASVAALEVDEHLRPRVIAAPPAAFMGRSRLPGSVDSVIQEEQNQLYDAGNDLPPDYVPFGRNANRTTSVRLRH